MGETDGKWAWLERVLKLRRPAPAAGRGDAGEGIEMTTFSTSGRPVPEGTPEADRAEVAQEARLFAVFPDDFSTYRDAATIEVSEQQRQEITAAYTKMLARAEAMKATMEQGGGKADLEKIAQTVFGHIPPGLVPPQFVAELQDWRRVRDAMTARAVIRGQAPPERAEKIKAGLDATALAATLTKGALSAVPGIGEKAAAAIEKVNLALEALAKALEAGSQGIDGARASTDKGKAVAEQSPVAIKLADAQLTEAVQGVAGLGIDIAGVFLPTVALLKNGADCIAAIKDTMARTKLRASTGELRDRAAIDATSQLSRAFEQSAGRETRLAVEGGVTAASTGVGAAAGVATATVIGAKVGAALQVTSTGISVAGKVVFGVFDETKAYAAVKTLERAQAGDTEAQQTVFSDNAHYAKMLIAVLAMDNNPLARKYLCDRGLEESDFDNPLTTADLLFDYGVYKSKEADEIKSKLIEAKKFLSGAAARLGEMAASAKAYLAGLVQAQSKPANTLPDIKIDNDAVLQKMKQDIANAEAALRANAAQADPDRALISQYTAMSVALADVQASYNAARNALLDVIAQREGAVAASKPLPGTTLQSLSESLPGLHAFVGVIDHALDIIAAR